MNTSKIFLLSLGILTLSAWIACADSFKHRFLLDGTTYDYRISSSQLERSPKWDTEKEENPPVSAAKAFAKAKQFISTIKTKPGFVWEFQQLSLICVGKVNGSTDVWAWRASWELSSAGKFGPIWPRMDSYILMDGTVLQPKVEIIPDQK